VARDRRETRAGPVGRTGRRRTLQAAAALTLLVLIAAAVAAGALQLQGAGTPAPGTLTRERDALWLGHAWVDGRKTPADAERLAASLRGTGVHDLYLHVGPLDDGGALDPSLRPYAGRLVRALHAALPGARVLAWVGGVVGRHRIDLGRPAVQERLLAAAGDVLGDGFDGVQYDLEPVRSGDGDFLSLLDGAHRLVSGRGAVLSVAAAKVAPLPGLGSGMAIAPAGPELWSATYLSAVARRVDQVVIMAYDTALPVESLYGGYVARQTRLALGAVPAHTDLLIGVPAYHDDNASHHAAAETLPAALHGIRLGLSDDVGRRRFGVALYVDFAATEADWRAYRDGWVGDASPAAR
jgi:hypothetical protein